MKLLFKKKSSNGLKTISFALIALALMLVDYHSSLLTKFRSLGSFVISPIEYVVSAPIDIVNDLLNDLTSKNSLLNENEQLKTNLALMKAQLQKQYAIESENKQLKELLQSSAKAGGRVTEAQILSISLDPNSSQIVIDKGKDDGVFRGQAVLDASGVMGQVVLVSPKTSHVMLLTSEKSAIPVEVQRNSDRAVLTGTGANNLLKLQYVTDTIDIKSGDLLITSGLGERFPYGYSVGKIISVIHNSGDRFADISVEPTAQINKSRLVLLVWPS